MTFKTKSGDSNSEHINIYFEDHGQGKPVILIHGWPLSHKMWEYQKEALVDAGFRVIAYDRRGFGHSDKPWSGYTYDHMTDDLHALITQLDLQDVTIVGFSMGGGEVARYFTRHGSDRIAKAVLISSVTPFMKKTDNNPEGVPQKVFDEMMENMKKDRIKFLKGFGKDFFGLNKLDVEVSEPLQHYFNMVAAFASPRATRQCAVAFSQTDFRPDMKNIDVPTLIIHGDADQTVPIETSGKKAAEMIANNQFEIFKDAPHGLFYTHREQLNKTLTSFLKKPVASKSMA